MPQYIQSFTTFEEAWPAVRTAGKPTVVKIAGHLYKLYAKAGKVLCAQSRPMHEPWGQPPCGCVHAEGDTIAEFTMPIRRSDI